VYRNFLKVPDRIGMPPFVVYGLVPGIIPFAPFL
jgi:hypothetical protein